MRKFGINAAWNVSGQLASLCAGLAALPLLLHALGAARLGIFTLALGLIGFSGLFDLGLGRALTQAVSSLLESGRSRELVAALVWRVVALLGCFGIVWLVALWAAAPFLTYRLFSLTGTIATETLFGLRAVAISVPFALAATGAMGALEGLQQFRILNLRRIPMSIVQFGLPVTVALLQPDLGWVIAALAATRALWLVLWVQQLHRFLPRTKESGADPADLRHTLRFGGWLSLSNAIAPLMTYADRFYLASLFPPAAVAHYTVPFDATSRLAALPQTAMNVLFPALAAAQAQSDKSAYMVAAATRANLFLMLPPVLIAALFAHPVLALWLGEAFAGPATPVLKLLLIGIFLNSAAYIPYMLLQAHGRSDLTAKLHLLELPAFALILFWAVREYGSTGAALAWTSRIGLDTALLYLTAALSYRVQRPALGKGALMLLLACCALGSAVYLAGFLLQMAIAASVCVLCGWGLIRLWYEWSNEPSIAKY